MLRELINTAETTAIEVGRIRSDGGTQMRAEINWDTVHEYRDAMQAGSVLPPPVLFYDGADYWVGDGFHRLAAWKLAYQSPGMPNECDRPIPCEVRSGTRRDAVLHAAGANAAHGLRRTSADKSRAVETLLRDQEWASWSDNEIARRCNVSPTFVGNVRRKLSLSTVDSEKPAAAPAERTYTTKHGTQATMRTGAIGTNRSVDQLIPTVLTFAKTFRTAHGESAEDYYNPYSAAHSNGQFWPAITKHLKTAGVVYRDDVLKQAIKQAFEKIEANRKAQPAVSPEQRQYESAVQSIDVPAWVPPGIGARTRQPGATPTLPADLEERGWQLRQVPGSGRWYANNPTGPRATGIHDHPADAIAEAYTMQVDLRSAPAAPEPDPEADAESAEAQAFAAAATHLDAAIASLQAAYRALAGHHDELQGWITAAIDDVKVLRREVEL